MATTFKTKLANKIKEAQTKTNKAQEKALEKLLDNDNFIEAQRTVTAKGEELDRLAETSAMLNSIAPFVARDGRKFSVNVFPIATFGIGLGTIVGIVSGSRSAFIDEKMAEYSAISGISVLELYEAQDALGSPAYYKDGKVYDSTPGDFSKLSNILEGIFIKLDLHELKVSDITKAKYDLWYALAETRANKALVEHETLQDLEANAEDFVMED